MAESILMKESSERDARVEAILAHVRRLGAGDFGVRTDLAENGDDLDALARELNGLARTLNLRAEEVKRKSARMDKLLSIMLRYTLLDFSEKAPVGGEGDEIDALSAGLNSLAEEVADHIARLEEKDIQIQTIFTNAPDAVVAIDEKNIIVRWNPAASKIFGWEKKEALGQPLHEVMVPERYRERHLEGIQRFLKTGKGPYLNHTVELPALCKDGSEIQVEMTISAARVDRRYLFISFLRDVTERKVAEEQIRQLNATLEQRVMERTRQLDASERKYRTLFENNPMPLWILDMETLGFLDVNESAVKHYGYSREEFLSMNSMDLRPADEKDRYAVIDRTIPGTRNLGVWKHRKKDGTIILSEITAHEMTFGGRPARLILANDVTEKVTTLQELQLSEARFRRIFDSKMTGFLFWDSEDHISEANDLFLEMVGYTRADLRGNRLRLNTMTPPEYLEADKIALEQIRLHGACDPFEKEYIRKDGSRIPVLIAAASIDDSLPVKGVTCVMDITQRKKMEEEIRELNRGLEMRIQERTVALQEVNKELESFTYSVSHDLRAPLRAIHGYSQMLLEDFEEGLGSEALRLLHNVQYNAKRMGQLVDDLLAFSRMGRRALTPSEIDLRKLAGEVVRELTEGMANYPKITVHSMGTVRGDESLLRQAFQNLISNALKYSSRRDDPEVEIGSKEISGCTAYFVKDNGAGFDMAYYNKLFGVFQRLHGQEEFEGTGVGLAIVQRIIHRHGGTIWAEGKVGEGAVFYFTLWETPGSDPAGSQTGLHPDENEN